MTNKNLYRLIQNYYGVLFKLLGQPPKINHENVERLHRLEQHYQIVLPDAAKAWYSIDGWEEILKDYSSFDYIDALSSSFQGEIWDDVTATEITTEEFERVQLYNQWSKNSQLISVFGEHQGMIQWYFLRNEEADPPILVYLEENPYQLLSFPHAFSKMIYLNIWDARLLGYWLEGYSNVFTGKGNWSEQFAFLQQHFNELPTTDLSNFLDIERKIFRFEQDGKQVSFWKEDKPQFMLFAKKLEVYQDLLNLFITSPLFKNAKEKLLEKLNAL